MQKGLIKYDLSQLFYLSNWGRSFNKLMSHIKNLPDKEEFGMEDDGDKEKF